MSFKPIPKHLLIHEVIYQAPKSDDDGSMGSGELPKPQKIEHVRFTPKRKRIVKMDNTEVLTNGVLYIDAVNSKPFVNQAKTEQSHFKTAN
ncbi:minor capsid protein [Enterococcus gallinarum]|nr:minor capsid protein [Enterococcus gallinarum]